MEESSSSSFVNKVLSLHQIIFLGAVTTSKTNRPFLTAASFSISSITGFASTNIGANIVTTDGFGVTKGGGNAAFINV